MSSSSAPTRKPAYDPVRKWGLKPEPSVVGRTGGSATYVVSGHIVGGPAGDSQSVFVAETMGREGQAKAKRKFGRDADRELKALLEKDKEGMRAVVRAREVAKMMDEKDGKRDKGKGKEVKTNDKVKRNAKGKEKPPAKARSEELSDSDSDSGSSLVLEDPTATSVQKNAYSAQIIKQLGFDPTMKPGQKRADDSAVKKKVRFILCILLTSFTECFG
jgi:minichromosome maintenance protein 10